MLCSKQSAVEWKKLKKTLVFIKLINTSNYDTRVGLLQIFQVEYLSVLDLINNARKVNNILKFKINKH